MNKIEGSVGQDGDNVEDDVRLVQQLLNRRDLAPLRKLQEDGRSGSSTIEAIRQFQARCLGMNSPDGRVDPEGRTLRELSNGGNERGTGENTETRKADRQARTERVDPRVKETALTTRIIDGLVPRLTDVRARIIAGFLSDADQFWKVNYHWEYLLQMVEHSLTLPLKDDEKKDLKGIRSILMGCKPDPTSGYATSPIGKPEDRSSVEDTRQRHKTLSSAKRTFGKLTDSAKLKKKSKKGDHAFDLAAAPVAPPGTSKHGTGYALDIEGENAAIKSLCKGLGATLVFDEKSHVHVEFKNGVNR
ncbi:MAG: M15 family metallopeptidase [Candidatus Dechloromonas phosphoritropha]|jgi:peptidoglycan hydrolase-like protein with peptidoglycan-binding domain|nr:peptidoglycan-binding protein [Candidatus Dechloromonas phosphoritropha]MBP8786206.1 peptidoglycan-binding protein [Azonexus sp.]MBP9226614.1 peptidoglycan-binding protein [Azonexus sp.]